MVPEKCKLQGPGPMFWVGFAQDLRVCNHRCLQVLASRKAAATSIESRVSTTDSRLTLALAAFARCFRSL